MRVRFTPRARDEAREAALAFRIEAPSSVTTFRERVRRARAQLSRFPQSGRPIGGDYRWLLLEPFPYYLVYRVSGGEVRVVAVIHTATAPDSWAGRP